MEAGEWYREKVYNSNTGEEEWKYYYVDNFIPETGTAELIIYKVNKKGKVMGPRNWSSSADLIEQFTKVSEEFASSILKL